MRVSGVGMALLAAALFGASTPLAKGLLQETSPQLLAGLLYLGSGAGLLLVWLGRRGGTRREAALSRSDLPWLAGAIASGGVLGPVLLMYGLLHAPASSANFALEAFGAESRGQLRMQHLHRDRSIVPEVLGEVHRRHATAADLMLE